MPTSFIRNIAKHSNRSVSEIEKLWDTAKAAALVKFKSDTDPRYWAYVTATVKKMVGQDKVIEENILSLVECSKINIGKMSFKTYITHVFNK